MRVLSFRTRHEPSEEPAVLWNSTHVATAAFGYPVLGCITFATQPPCTHFLSLNDYNHSVRNYTTQRIKGGMQFTCIHCPHSVRTVDFDVKYGNLRTQAATALNQHAAEAHNEPMIISSPNVQQRIWRS